MEHGLKVLILGHANHGKTTFAKMLGERFDLKHYSRDRRVSEQIAFPWFQRHCAKKYATAEACYEDRRMCANFQERLARTYLTEDRTKLAREILAEADICVGMRSVSELNACLNRKLFTHVFWVDASRRCALEAEHNMSIIYRPLFMRRIDNNGDEQYLQRIVNTIDLRRSTQLL